MPAMRVERVGVATSRATGCVVMYHRGTVKLSRKFRVYPVPGDLRFMDLDPVEFAGKYKSSGEQKVELITVSKAIEILTKLQSEGLGEQSLESRNTAGDEDYVRSIVAAKGDRVVVSTSR